MAQRARAGYHRPMCGRFTRAYTWAEVERFLSLIGSARNLRPCYKIAPTTLIDVLRIGETGVSLSRCVGALSGRNLSASCRQPSTPAPRRWPKSPFPLGVQVAPLHYPGRASTSGQASGARRRHTIFRRQTAARWPLRAYGSAGEIQRRKKKPVESATIVVGPANEWMRLYHDRMPVILDWSDAGAWMAGEQPGGLLRPPPEDALQEWIVSPRVNRSGVGDDDPALIEAAETA